MPVSIHIHDPADLIAVVPAMLGFTPVRSLVLLFVTHHPEVEGSTVVQFLVRMESPLQDHRLSDDDIAQYAADMCARMDAHAVLAVLVDDRLSRPTHADAADARCRSALQTLRTQLQSVERALAGAWCTSALAAHTEWWSEATPEQYGYLPDPTASRIAAEYTAAGRPIHATRTDLIELLDVDHALRHKVTDALDDAAAQAHRRFVRAVQIGDPSAYSRQALWQVMQTIAHTSTLEVPTPRALADVAVALRDPVVREAMFGVADGEHAHRAHQLWTILTRALPDPDRAEAAMLLAFSAYLHGDGALAGIALDTALASDPDHRMAQLLDLALSTAMPPHRLRRLCEAGIESATELRIDIGVAAHDSPIDENP
ncbi:DUF4192 domain-containing protein [Nocardia sp. NPDC052001]|uniref:DUF4192 domain-containing protein n=1 Tax=Nocardia sp. NPDC052001 TaxID=3154853 RepID=UPI00342032F4